jgi:hypothetical protein
MARWALSGSRGWRTPFIVPYRVAGNMLQILRIFHGARKRPETF